ncbi:hypothetical protein [Nocardia alni]|uniref:hypothetical protein n=1 Tax=Nocardia alni TaxID=2815723 RepID=UPI001C221B6F|nr:hypothetical protein [Nocardia alni]
MIATTATATACFTPTAIRTRDNIAAVVMDSEDARFVIIMEGDDGLAFAIARAHRDSEPEVYVHTRDGRRVLARH